MIRLLMFATVRDATGLPADQFAAGTLSEVLARAVERYGAPFARALQVSRVWVNGDEPASRDVVLVSGDEVAIIPPVAGG
jgi:molybdopterin converting factor small subunit